MISCRDLHYAGVPISRQALLISTPFLSPSILTVRGFLSNEIHTYVMSDEFLFLLHIVPSVPPSRRLADQAHALTQEFDPIRFGKSTMPY